MKKSKGLLVMVLLFFIIFSVFLDFVYAANETTTPEVTMKSLLEEKKARYGETTPTGINKLPQTGIEYQLIIFLKMVLVLCAITLMILIIKNILYKKVKK